MANGESSNEKPGWYSRGYLPHFDVPDKVQCINFHLADSLPNSVVLRIGDEIKSLPEALRVSERKRRLEKWLDQGHGACWLREDRYARMVEESLLAGDGDQYMLLGWCVMPNHVHVAAEFSDVDLIWKVVKGWKGTTAVQINRSIGKTGSFWFREYYDRYVRDAQHLKNALRYIDQNPVKAKLCRAPTDWKWGSASWLAGRHQTNDY